jgi:hypothetical protein
MKKQLQKTREILHGIKGITLIPSLYELQMVSNENHLLIETLVERVSPYEGQTSDTLINTLIEKVFQVLHGRTTIESNRVVVRVNERNITWFKICGGFDKRIALQEINGIKPTHFFLTREIEYKQGIEGLTGLSNLYDLNREIVYHVKSLWRQEYYLAWTPEGWTFFEDIIFSKKLEG